jgi:NagD protein
MIEKATGKSAYFVGKPNPLMMRKALRRLGVHSTDTAIIGDRMDTDIVAGVEAGLVTILVLSGVTAVEDIKRYPYRPDFVFRSVAEIGL